MSVTIDGVPESITRAEYTSLLGSLGLDAMQLRSLQFAPEGIYASVFALDEHGQRILVQQLDDQGEPAGETTLAKHTVFIKVGD